jgi:hypothetical protein
MPGRLSALLEQDVSRGSPSPLLADAWDPSTRDYSSLSAGFDVVDAAVITALCTVRGSGASVMEVGLGEIPAKITSAVENEIESGVRLALQALSRAGDVRVRRVDVAVDQGAQQVTVRLDYANLRAGAERSVPVPLPVPGSR